MVTVKDEDLPFCGAGTVPIFQVFFFMHTNGPDLTPLHAKQATQRVNIRRLCEFSIIKHFWLAEVIQDQRAAAHHFQRGFSCSTLQRQKD